MTSANRDGTPVAKDPIRLYLSGGGHRAALGSVGAIAALVDLDEWPSVSEVVSVSGGSFPNAVLVADGPTELAHEPLAVLAAMTQRLLDDGLRLFANARRALIVGAIATTVGVAIGTVLIAVGVGPWSPPRWVTLVVGVLVVPITLFIVRRLAAAGFGNFVATVIGSKAGAELASKTPARQHLFCAAGLSSGVPYTFWAGPKPPAITWGECLHEGYTVHDAATASSALPGLGGVAAPASLRGELIVDGGVVGIFGQQTYDPLKRRALRGEVRKVSIDAGRHSAPDGAFGPRLARLSVLYALSRWLKVSLEATYVNDLDDAKGDTLIRICWDRSMTTPPGPLGPALECLARNTSSLGLSQLRTDGALDALVSGYAHTLVAFRSAATADEVEAGLDRLGHQLGLNLRTSWDRARKSAPSPEPVETN